MSTKRETVKRYVVYQRLLPIEDRLKQRLATVEAALRDLCDAIPEKTLDADPPLKVWWEQAEQALALIVSPDTNNSLDTNNALQQRLATLEGALRRAQDRLARIVMLVKTGPAIAEQEAILGVREVGQALAPAPGEHIVDANKMVADQTKKERPSHVCGLQGFGADGDECPACRWKPADQPGGEVE